jgi:hypothetical protein
VERLTPEQIRLLEELRELRDTGILTVEEFEFQVAKVLGRPQVVEPIPLVEEPLAPKEPEETAVAVNLDEAQQVEQSDVANVVLVPDTSHESELLEYELVEPGFSDEGENLVEENQVAEPPSISDTSALPIVETEPQQNSSSRHSSSRRKILIGTTVGLALVAVIVLVALGGGKSDSTSSQIIENTSIVTQSTTPVTTKAPTASTTTTTEAIPTTTYEVLQCPYTRVIEAIDGKIVTPEGITFEILPTTYKSIAIRDGYSVSVDEYVPYKFGHIEVTNSTNFRLRIGMEVQSSWANGSSRGQWGPDEGRGFLNGFETLVIRVPSGVYNVYSEFPINDVHLKMISATIKYLCP